MDRKPSSYGPSIVVLITVALVIFAGPYAVERLTYAQTRARIEQATNRLQSGDNILREINDAHRDIATKVAPSVVYISTERSIEARGRDDSLMRLSSGSGWVYDDLGHVVTNAHVIDGADSIEVQLQNGELRPALRVGTDPHTDIAVLRIDAGGLHPAERGTEPVRQGERVYAFGSPFDFRFSMSQGIVSGEGRHAQLDTVFYQNFIQVDAAINPGNSGGPLTNVYGQVVGMNTAIATGRQGSVNEGVFSGIGLAIPIDMIETTVDQLIETGEVTRGFLGVTLFENLSEGIARRLGFRGEGVEVREVNPESPAERAGLQSGDVIASVEGTRVATVKQMQTAISSHAPGDALTVRVWRYDHLSDEGEEFDLDVTLTLLRPEQMLDARIRMFMQRLGFDLLHLVTSTESRTSSMNVPFRRGVLVEDVARGGPIEDAIPPGSVITHVYDDAIQNIDEFYARLERALLASPLGVQIRIVRPDGSEDVVNLRP